MSNFVQKCPWCKTEYFSTTLVNCQNCGGTLEYQSRGKGDPGPKPPVAPRVLPQKYIRRITFSGNVMSMLGFVFVVVFFWSIIFPIIGIFLWRAGRREAKRELIPLQNGDTVLGEIASIERDYTKKMNGKSPFIIEFNFEVNGKKYRGNVGNIFESVDFTKSVGDKVWVVYMPEDPEELSSIWPPLK